MRLKTKLISAMGGFALLAGGAPAMAGDCGPGYAMPDCPPAVKVVPYAHPGYDPIIVRTETPMGHLKEINYRTAPVVNITRVHAVGAPVELSDAPVSFTGGCHPQSTAYCRTAARPAPAAPLMKAPKPAPMAKVSPVYVPAPKPVAAKPAAPKSKPVSVVLYDTPVEKESWKTVSGPTKVDGMLATKVVCRHTTSSGKAVHAPGTDCRDLPHGDDLAGGPSVHKMK